MAVSRKKSREIVFRMLFPLGFVGAKGADGVVADGGEARGPIGGLDATDDVLELASWEETPAGPERKYIDNLYRVAIENLPAIDTQITERTDGFTIDRIFKTDLAAIRLGLAEIKYTDTDKKVVINECVEIAKRYGTEKSGSFVNGVLEKV